MGTAAKQQCKVEFKENKVTKKICEITAKQVLKNTENPPDPTDACMDQGWCFTRSPTMAPAEKPAPTNLPAEEQCLPCMAFLSEYNLDKVTTKEVFKENLADAKIGCKTHDEIPDKSCKNAIKAVKKEKDIEDVCSGWS